MGLSLAAASCGEDGGISVTKPRLVLNPDANTLMEFEEVILTRSKAEPKIIKIGNKGDGPLNVNAVEIEGDTHRAFVVSSFPQLVLQGNTGEVFIRFNAATPGDHQATLKILTNDPERPEVSYPLKGPAREPCVLYADQGRIFFLIDEIKELTISSLSTHECVVDRLFVDRGAFEILNEPEIPFTVPAQGSLKLQIQHKPVSTRYPGAPVRDLLIRETEGSETLVLLEGEPPVSGCLDAFPDTLIFNKTELGMTRRERVRVSNRCGRSAIITSAVIGQGYDVYAVGGEYPRTVGPGQTVEIEVTYSPKPNISQSGRLTINTTDAATPRFRIPLSGDAAFPGIEYFPYTLDFGTVIFRNPGQAGGRSECSSPARFVKVHSQGDAPLTIQSLEVDQSGHKFFEITGVTVDGTAVQQFNRPFSIAKGKSAEIALQFYPTMSMPEDHVSTLIVRHNAAEMEARVQLRGQGAQDGMAHDQFEQLEGPKVDILWVIDNSCSMYDEQARLVENMSQFVGYADSQNADYQMGVLTTDSLSPEAGKLEHCYPHPRIVKHDYARREEAFECLFQVGTNGPYIEAGLGAAVRAIQRALGPERDPVRNPNIGFIRDDATLAIVAVSDEDDQSQYSDQLMLDLYNSVHGPGRTVVHAIAGPVDEPCETRMAQEGIRYWDMVRRTGGIFQNICRLNWQPVLRNLGLNVFRPIEEFTLSQAADPASVSVSVDGRPVVWSESSGFTYNPTTNAIRFHGPAVPGPGQQINVDYLGNCRP